MEAPTSLTDITRIIDSFEVDEATKATMHSCVRIAFNLGCACEIAKQIGVLDARILASVIRDEHRTRHNGNDDRSSRKHCE
jgi:hypothetical protein